MRIRSALRIRLEATSTREPSCSPACSKEMLGVSSSSDSSSSAGCLRVSTLGVSTLAQGRAGGSIGIDMSEETGTRRKADPFEPLVFWFTLLVHTDAKHGAAMSTSAIAK